MQRASAIHVAGFGLCFLLGVALSNHLAGAVEVGHQLQALTCTSEWKADFTHSKAACCIREHGRDTVMESVAAFQRLAELSRNSTRQPEDNLIRFFLSTCRVDPLMPWSPFVHNWDPYVSTTDSGLTIMTTLCDATPGMLVSSGHLCVAASTHPRGEFIPLLVWDAKSFLSRMSLQQPKQTAYGNFTQHCRGFTASNLVHIKGTFHLYFGLHCDGALVGEPYPVQNIWHWAWTSLLYDKFESAWQWHELFNQSQTPSSMAKHGYTMQHRKEDPVPLRQLFHMRDPFLFEDNAKYALYFTTSCSSMYFGGCVGLAVSDTPTGPFVLRKATATRVDIAHEVERVQVIKREGRYHMFGTTWSTTTHIHPTHLRNVTPWCVVWHFQSNSIGGPFTYVGQVLHHGTLAAKRFAPQLVPHPGAVDHFMVFSFSIQTVNGIPVNTAIAPRWYPEVMYWPPGASSPMSYDVQLDLI